MDFHWNVEYKQIGSASFITKHRYNQLSWLMKDVEECVGHKILNRQVGNVTNQLRNLGESDLIIELNDAIEAYNQEVDEHNRLLHDSKRVARRAKVSLDRAYEAVGMARETGDDAVNLLKLGYA